MSSNLPAVPQHGNPQVPTSLPPNNVLILIVSNQIFVWVLFVTCVILWKVLR
jgi:hypothetical protein